MILLFYLLIFIVGIHVGSFLNVVIDRMPLGKNFIIGRSHCDNCQKHLTWSELIPLLSYALLRGKCKHCKHHLSIFYPIIEMFTGLVFIVSSYVIFGLTLSRIYSLGFDLAFIYALFISSCLICIFFIDYKFGIIPFKIVLLAVIGALIWYFISPIFKIIGPFQTPYSLPFGQNGIGNYVLSSMGSFLFFFILFAITRGRGMGFGDVTYALLMGLLLGFPRIIVGLYVAFLTGAFISLILVLVGKKRFSGGTIPFGPFLVLGTLIGFFCGQYVINIVSQYLHG